MIGAAKLRRSSSNLTSTQRNPPTPANKGTTPASETQTSNKSDGSRTTAQQVGAGPSTSKLRELAPRPEKPRTKYVTPPPIPNIHQAFYLMGTIHYSPAKNANIFAGYVYTCLSAALALTFPSFQGTNLRESGT